MKNLYQKVYEVVKKIPKGKVATYGQIARIIGSPHSSQRVGFALHANKDSKNVPCYRVVNRFGEVAESFCFGGGQIQRQMLEQDGIEFGIDGRIDLDKYLWKDE